MNFVFFSPHFPTNFAHFCVNLAKLGVNVLGIADAPVASLPRHLRAALTDYYQVSDLHDYDSLVRACGYFTHRYGKLDRLDSHNEYWLETEAQLRTDFNITGIKAHEISRIKKKSEMKQVFADNGIPFGQGTVVNDLDEAMAFIAQVGYPVVVKPDIGVGAASTFKLENQQELRAFFASKPKVSTIMEEFLGGQICSFDGLTDHDGNIVFYSSTKYSQGVMEVVNDDDHIYYYTLRDIPADLVELGFKMVKAFQVRERFFHFEFFRSPDGRLTALEVNVRPPGGLTLDMFNFSHDIDLYREWANMIVYNRFMAKVERKYHCCYIGRKQHKAYRYSHAQILQAFGDQIVLHQAMSPIFSRAMGQYCYLIRSTDESEIIDIAETIHAEQDVVKPRSAPELAKQI